MQSPFRSTCALELGMAGTIAGAGDWAPESPPAGAADSMRRAVAAAPSSCRRWRASTFWAALVSPGASAHGCPAAAP
eukprot:scaffold84178_cov30-Tisochrysis_lutea.AAC.4